VVLHGDEAAPSIEARNVQRLGELPRIHGRCADVADLARLDRIVESFERFFDGRFVVPAMRLIEIDVVGLETMQLWSSSYMIALRERPRPLGSSHGAADLGGDHHGLAANVVLPEEAANDDFAVAAE